MNSSLNAISINSWTLCQATAITQKSPIVIFICPLNALIECHMKQLEHQGISCTCLSGDDADQDGTLAGRYSFIFGNP